MGLPEPEIVHYNPKDYDFGKSKAFPMRDQHFFASVDKASLRPNTTPAPASAPLPAHVLALVSWYPAHPTTQPRTPSPHSSPSQAPPAPSPAAAPPLLAPPPVLRTHHHRPASRPRRPSRSWIGSPSLAC